MYGLILAFKEFQFDKGILYSPWVGFNNFIIMFGDNDFWAAFKNTIIISGGKLLTAFPAPIILALLLNELTSSKFKRIVQSIMYLPHFLSWVIIAGIIYGLLSSTDGVVTKIVQGMFNADMPQIISNYRYARSLIFTSNIWQSVGWGTIIYLAAIAGIDPSFYESAMIDGANRFHRMIYITLPSLSYAILILFILQIGGIMNAGFDQIINLYSPSTYNVLDILDTYVYRIGIANASGVSHMEYGVAVGLVESVLNLCLLLFANSIIIKRLGRESFI